MRSQIKQWIEAPNGAVFLYTGAISFLIGVCWYTLHPLGLYMPLVGFGIGAGALLALFVRKDMRALLVLVCAVLISLGALRVLSVPDVQTPFVPYDGARVTVEGVIDEDPDRRDTSTHVVVAVTSINEVEVSGTLQATLDRTVRIAYGDHMHLEGRLELPKPFETETGKEFDYGGYLRAKGIGAVLSYPTFEIEEPAGRTFFGTLFFIKHALETSIERVLPEPAAGLLEGILLGNRAALGQALYAIFIIAGLVHVVVLSGYNLTIVAEALMRVFSGLPKKVALLSGVSGIILFALSVGAEATVIRATIMALIVVVGRALQRPNEALRALVFACVCMVLYNPYILMLDPSFVLSFLAAFGLITLSPLFAEKLAWVPARFSVREIVSATLATQAFVFPAIIFYTGRLSLVALPANLLALPLIPYAMLFGFCAGVLGLLHPFLALLAGVPAWATLSLVVYIARAAASIPMAVVLLPSFQTPYIFALYAGLVPLAVWAYARRHI